MYAHVPEMHLQLFKFLFLYMHSLPKKVSSATHFLGASRAPNLKNLGAWHDFWELRAPKHPLISNPVYNKPTRGGGS
jgi:hypothetical protein